MGCQFTALLGEEWQGVLYWRWNSKRPLFFTHVVLNKTLVTHKARDIQARINLRLDLLERGLPTGLVGSVLAEGRAKEGCATRSDKEDEDRLVRSFHSTFLSVKLRQVVCRSADREGGVSYPGGRLHEDRETSC